MADQQKYTILIVDDEYFMLQALTATLSPHYTVLAAKDGCGAVAIAHKAMPDLILMDVIMPKMDGFEALAALKASEATKHIPVILLSGLEEINTYAAAGAADRIAKPFRPDDLKQKVQRQLGRRE